MGIIQKSDHTINFLIYSYRNSEMNPILYRLSKSKNSIIEYGSVKKLGYCGIIREKVLKIINCANKMFDRLNEESTLVIFNSQ